MQTTRRAFLQTSSAALASKGLAQHIVAEPTQGESALEYGRQKLDAFSIAKKHVIRKEIPGPTFLEGMLLGNGDIGVCAMVRPDALGLHIGKNDCWDIRVSEDIVGEVLPFPELLALWRRASEEAKKQGKPDMLHLESNIDFFRAYTERVSSSYRNRWPRPWPCGTVWINWDPRWVTPSLYTLDPSNGMFELDLQCSSLETPSRTVRLSAFVDGETGLISASTSEPISLLSVVYSPEVDGLHGGPFDPGRLQKGHDLLPSPRTSIEVGERASAFSCHQYLPAIGPTRQNTSSPKSDKDRNFSLRGTVAGQWSTRPSTTVTDLTFVPTEKQSLALHVYVATPRDIFLRRLEKQAAASGQDGALISVPQNHAYSAEDLDTEGYARQQLEALASSDARERQRSSEDQWREHWSHSAVEIKDPDLERIWYLNQYFLACCLRKHKTAPGLFANWSAGNIGTAWHGDYHADYNCQQVYWGVFSSNQPDLHLPYIELCENLLPIAETFAHDKFNLPGACFPLSSFPVPSQILAYPVPPWAYQISLIPWTVQSLWWHYLYTQDEAELRRAYPILRSAARFIAAYLQKGSDGKYHVIPTVSSENWGFTVDQRLNKDCILDLALIRFLLNAVVEASTLLDTDAEERTRWSEIHRNIAPYPTVNGAYGKVWLDVLNAPPDHIYNIPITLAPVFPGEQVGMDAGEDLEIARRTARTIRLEGGNDLVYQPLIRARLGMLDLDWFKREVQYCSLPDGVANDRIRQSGGRYPQSANFDFMMPMGVWCENFSLPAVLNECMLQSYSGVLHLFPNTINLGPARFSNLRAVGAFLVSAAHDGKAVTELSIVSEKGKTLRLAMPWRGRSVNLSHGRDQQRHVLESKDGILTIETDAGQEYRFAPATAV